RITQALEELVTDLGTAIQVAIDEANGRGHEDDPELVRVIGAICKVFDEALPRASTTGETPRPPSTTGETPKPPAQPARCAGPCGARAPVRPSRIRGGRRCPSSPGPSSAGSRARCRAA